MKNLSSTMYEQAHRFVLMEHPHLASWRDDYAQECTGVEDSIPAFSIWLRDRILLAEGTRDRVDDIVHCLALGLAKKAQFYGSAIQKGRHFKIAERDTKRKTTFDSGILAYFDVGRDECTPFYGVLTYIIRLQYGKYGQTLFRGMWYDNKGTRSKGSTTVLTDECGITRVKATPMPYQEKVTFDPFVCLSGPSKFSTSQINCIQVGN